MSSLYISVETIETETVPDRQTEGQDAIEQINYKLK